MAEKWEHLLISSGDDGGYSNRDHQNSSDMVSDKFPKGLRVLAFDEDPQCLFILKKHLEEFQYKVMPCEKEENAMFLLRNHRNMFDIAIVQAQYGDRFRLISEIGLEMDLPIIIISEDDSVESVINWMKNGACDYLIKPIRSEDLRLIFKHVVKKMEVRRSLAVAGEAEEKAAAEKSSSVGDSTIRNPNTRKRSMFLDGQSHEEDQDHGRDSTTKKKRVVWDENIHNVFLEAVNYLGPEAVPKKILERMNMPNITRENVASHLQKYRLNLKRQANEQKNDGKQTNDKKEERNRFPTRHINDIPQPSSVQQKIPNPSVMMHFISPGGCNNDNNDDGVSVAVSNRNIVVNHQHHHPHQMSEFTWIDQNAFHDDEAGIATLTSLFTQNSEEMSLFDFHEPVIATAEANDIQLFANPQHMTQVHEPSMVHIHSVPSSLTHGSFFDQKVTMANICGQHGYPVNSNKLA